MGKEAEVLDGHIGRCSKTRDRFYGWELVHTFTFSLGKDRAHKLSHVPKESL